MENRGNINSMEYRNINERAYDLLGEILLQQETDVLLAEIEKDKAVGNTKDMDAFTTRYDAKNLAKIHRYFRLQRARTFLYHTLPKIGQIAAILIAIVTLAGGVAIATSHTVSRKGYEIASANRRILFGFTSCRRYRSIFLYSHRVDWRILPFLHSREFQN